MSDIAEFRQKKRQKANSDAADRKHARKAIRRNSLERDYLVGQAFQADKNKSRIKENTPFEKCEKYYSWIKYRFNPNWKPKSHNFDRQMVEFFNTFIYRYHVPEALLFTATGHLTPSNHHKMITDPSIGMLSEMDYARYLIKIIVSGESFFKKNKESFNKKESHYFCSSKTKYLSELSLKKLILEARVNAHGMPIGIGAKIIIALNQKNAGVNSTFIREFIDFLARTNADLSINDIGDIWDAVNWKHNNGGFSFSKRTLISVINLTNEWHEDLAKDKIQLNSYTWEGLPLEDATYETADAFYYVTQIKTTKALSKEGKAMHHCVGAYADRCKKGQCGIFTIKKFLKQSSRIVDLSTVEVNPYGRVVQHRGPFNQTPTNEALSILNKWSKENL
jgi:hypothetical protein